MKYIYGPVQSRRLGLSLGVSLTAYKICSFDCVYCQQGKTTEVTVERREYIPIQEIIDELKSWFLNHSQEAGNLKFITISGSGEPTLNIEIGTLISKIREITPVPVALITNASLLNTQALRLAVKEVDLIAPSLDAVTVQTFQRINRPHPDIKIQDVINGLIELRKEFSGKIWLEVMLVSGINDDIRQIKKLKEAIDRINPDKIQLNSPVRTTAEPKVFPVNRKKLEKIKEILGEKCEVV